MFIKIYDNTNRKTLYISLNNIICIRKGYNKDEKGEHEVLILELSDKRKIIITESETINMVLNMIEEAGKVRGKKEKEKKKEELGWKLKLTSLIRKILRKSI